MPNKTETNSAGAANWRSTLAAVPADLMRDKIAKYLDAQSIISFSSTCKAVLGTLSAVRNDIRHKNLHKLLILTAVGDRALLARTTIPHITPSLLFKAVVRNNEVLTKKIAAKRRLLLQDPIVLLAAVVQGNEEWAREILTANPVLILDKSATVKDLSGKEIKGLTALQAARCAWDVKMVQMMEELLLQQVQAGASLGFDPEAEIARQFAEIFPEGMDKVDTAQQAASAEFKKSTLQNLFDAINAATSTQVEDELNTPGRELNNPDEKLNEALHEFRKYFSDRSNANQIFNPYDLLEAFNLYYEKFNAFKGYPGSAEQWNRRKLFLRQVIGYIQRHLPACYWQEFARHGEAVGPNEKLERNFEFKFDQGFYMRAQDGDLNNLGYRYVGRGGVVLLGGLGAVLAGWAFFQNLLRTKKSGLENLRASRAAAGNSRITYRPGA